MFTRDGKKLVSLQTATCAKPGDTNVFIADWGIKQAISDSSIHITITRSS